jgi:hypothetical protein
MQAQLMESRERTEGKVNESRAAALLGLSTQKLRRLSEESGIGQLDVENGGAQLVFTYAELYRLCRLAAETGGPTSS